MTYNMKLTEEPLIDIRDAFFETLYSKALEDQNLILLSADMGAKSFDKFRENIPDQIFNIGVAEQNLISLAAGLTLGGKKVITYGISSFLVHRSRAQIRHDLCIMNLPVIIVGSGPGVVYDYDGPCHHAIEDVATMRSLPGMNIFSPCDQTSAASCAISALNCHMPSYVRLDKGTHSNLYLGKEKESSECAVLKEGNDILFVTTGIMSHKVTEVISELSKEGISCGHLDIVKIHPIDQKMICSEMKKYKAVVTAEEHLLQGGLGSIIAECTIDNNLMIPVKRFGFRDEYRNIRGSRFYLHKEYGLDLQNIVSNTIKWYKLCS
jgi:transketolase